MWNWLDAIVVVGSFLLFLVIALSSSSPSDSETTKNDGNQYIEEVGEIALLAVWAAFQTLRVIFIAKRQRLAQQSANQLIDFTHNIIVVESEAGVGHHINDSHNTDRPGIGDSRPSVPVVPGGMRNGDEVIVFDMK